MQQLSFPIRVCVAVVVAAGVMLAVPTLTHLVFGSPVEIPIAWSPASLVSSALAALVCVAFLAWRPPSGWSTLLAAVVAAAVMTAVPLLGWEGWWQLVVVYLVVFGVYLACPLAAVAAAAVVHSRPGLRFARPAPTSA